MSDHKLSYFGDTVIESMKQCMVVSLYTYIYFFFSQWTSTFSMKPLSLPCLREDIDFLEGQFPMAGYIFWFTLGRGRTWLLKAGARGPFSNQMEKEIAWVG